MLVAHLILRLAPEKPDDRRAAAALTHPITVGAVAILLINDLVFKSIWPGSWATGKLSDLLAGLLGNR